MPAATPDVTPAGLTTVALADLPAEPGWYPVARLGQYEDRRYGKFAITAQMVASWQRNLADRQHGEAPIDYDHRSETGDTRAAGWLRALKVVGKTVLGRIDWTDEGADAVKRGLYRYVSPTFTAAYKDEQGKSLGPALLGVALTNRPFLREGMPALNLNAGDPFAVALDAAPDAPECPDCGEPMKPDPNDPEAMVCEGCGTRRALSAGPNDNPPSDSTGEGEPMPEPTGAERQDTESTTRLDADAAGADTQETTMPTLPDTFRLALGLDADADDAAAADAIRTLRADAEAGREAREQLRVQTFTLAYGEAVREGRVAPAQEETLRALYDAEPEQTLKLMAEAQPVAPVALRGTGGTGPDADASPFADGQHAVDEDRLELMAKAEALAAKESIDLITAAERVAAGMTSEA